MVVPLVADEGGPEGMQALQGGRVGTQGRRARKERRLKLLLPVVQEGDEQPGPVAEAPEDRPLADPGRRGHRLHGQVLRPGRADIRRDAASSRRVRLRAASARSAAARRPVSGRSVGPPGCWTS